MFWNPSRPPGSRTIQLFILSLSLLIAPAFGQENPSFLIETITVENVVHFSPSIVVAESLLEPGRSYTEAELSHAIHRIIRLPLILDASFNLRKGTERDHYELVITVEEARRWFFGETGEFDLGDPVIFFSRTFPGEDALRLIEDDELSHLAGHRSAIGAYGVLSAAVEPSSRGKVQLGYTQYNLLDRNIQLNIQYLFEPLFQRSNEDTDIQTTRIKLGFPLWGDHSLWYQVSFQNLESQSSFDFLDEHVDRERVEEHWNHNVSWVFNSLDDPVFPRSGTFIRTGVEYKWIDSSYERTQSSGDFVEKIRYSESWSQISAFVTADQYWSISKKDSLSISVDLAAFRDKYAPNSGNNTIGTDINEWTGVLSLGHSRFLYRDTQKPRWRELLWENSLGYYRRDVYLSFSDRWPLEEFRLRTGLKYRTSWGVFGLAITYLERPGDL